MNALEKIIHDQVRRFGPITIAEYMTLCLLHPEHGYYTTGDPLGRDGDFTTAPEISQMFGEMLGLCLAQAWQDQGCPSPFILAELGPGRGTLMADILRICSRVAGFVAAAEVWLVEASPVLRKSQKSTLRLQNIHWADHIIDLPEKTIFLIANEFFDVLPIRQFKCNSDGWQEQVISREASKLGFGLTSPKEEDLLADRLGSTEPGTFVELNTGSESIVGEISRRIQTNGGAALIIDYGDWGSSRDTLQAVRAHQKVDPLENPGDCDLTAHVDFAAIAKAADGVDKSAMTSQGMLLERLGITERAQALAANLAGAALEEHIVAHRRLTHPDEMGSLFKAIALYPEGASPPPGFD